MRALKPFGIVVGLVMAASVAQIPGNVIAPFASLGILVAILLLAISGGRPQRTSGSGRTTTTKARIPSYFVRYKVATAGSIPAAILAGTALAEVSTSLGASTGTAFTAALFSGFLLFIASIQLAALALGIAGGTAVALSFFYGTGPCVDALSAESLAVFTGTIVLALAVTLVPLFTGSIPAWILPTGLVRMIPRRLPSRRAAGSRVLALYGLIELASFAARPAGAEIWQEAAPMYRWLFALLILVVSVFGAYAPELVLALMAIGVLTASVILIGYNLGSSPSCGDSAVWIAAVTAGTAGSWAGSAFSFAKS